MNVESSTSIELFIGLLVVVVVVVLFVVSSG